MITLKDIYLQNFMSISELSMSFEDDTIVAITGENGSGKSALLYAIAFAITGYRYGESYRSYVKTGTDSAKILLNATFKGYPINYDIEIMSPNKKVTPPVRKKITYKDKVYLNSEYEQFIKEHELSDLESLMCIFGNHNNDIIDAKPGDRATTLRKIFKIEFGDAVKAFKEKQEELKVKNIELATKINELNNRIFEKQALLRTLSRGGLEDKKQQLYEVNLDLSNIANVDEASIKKYDDWLKSTQASISQETSRLNIDKGKKSQYETTISQIKETLNDIDVEKLKEEKSNLLLKKENMENSLKELRDTLREKLSEESVLKYNVKELKEQVAVCATGICHACGHEIDEAHTEKIRKEKDAAEKKLKEMTTLTSGLKKDIEDFEDDISSKSNSISKITSTISRKEAMEKDLEMKTSQLESVSAMIEDREKNIERLEQDKIRIENEKLELDKLKPLLEKRKELEATKKSLEDLIKKTEGDWIRNEEKRTSNRLVESEKIKRDEAVKNLTEEQNNIALRMSTIKQSIEVFDTLFPNYIILQACEQLEDYINSIVQRMFPYMRVSLKLSRSGVNFYYLSESSEEEWLSVKMASKAQKKTLALAYQVALAKMYGLSCVLIDEVDDAMSDENAKIVYKFMASLDDFQQIIFISHRQESLNAMMNSNRDNVVMYRVSHGEYDQV